MKKPYIQPLVEFEKIESFDILAGSPTGSVTGDDAINGTVFNNENIDTYLGEGAGDGTDYGAKQSTFIWDDEF